MPEIKRSLPIVFVRYSGTENGLTSSDTTACSDSLASMIANSIFITEPVQAEFEKTTVPVEDPSKYDA